MTNDVVDVDLTLDGEKIEFVPEFVYLGSILSFHNVQTKEISRRTQNGWRAFWKLRPYLISKKISLHLRLKLFKMCILPVLTYACGTWTMTKRNQNSLDVTHLAMLRRILGVSRKDRIRNEVIYETTQSSPLSKYVDVRRWKWAGHIARRTDNRWTEAVTSWWPRELGKRRRGAQKKRWKDDFKRRSKKWWRDARDRCDLPPLPRRPNPLAGRTSRPS